MKVLQSKPKIFGTKEDLFEDIVSPEARHWAELEKAFRDIRDLLSRPQPTTIVGGSPEVAVAVRESAEATRVVANAVASLEMAMRISPASQPPPPPPTHSWKFTVEYFDDGRIRGIVADRVESCEVREAAP